ncbi:MAG: ornithine carbamoyltransferase [Dehalococcoidia bacterium]|nr:ornithine carbamoyltransferase [Dehalococcoidia bacterium]
MKSKDLVSVTDLSAAEIKHLLTLAAEMKRGSPSQPHATLKGKMLALVFEKPSLRTRVSFEVAMSQLGGQAIYLSPVEVGLGRREPVPDVARVLSRYVDAIAARTFSHENVALLARFSSVPVINALSDEEHPCQALADLLTIFEKKGKLAGLTLTYVGDGNNVSNSLLLACALVGMNFRFAGPQGYWPPERIMRQAKRLASRSGSLVSCTDEVREAVQGADAVYTDVWTSMGQEAEREKRQKDFKGYQVDTGLFSLSAADALLMHPMPVHYGEEMAEGMSDIPQSVLFDQAENRLHLQKALLLDMIGECP